MHKFTCSKQLLTLWMYGTVYKIDSTLAVIHRIQGHRSMAYQFLGTLVVALLVGITNFLSRVAFDWLSDTEYYESMMSRESQSQQPRSPQQPQPARELTSSSDGNEQRTLEKRADAGDDQAGLRKSVLEEDFTWQLLALLFAGLAAVYVHGQSTHTAEQRKLRAEERDREAAKLHMMDKQLEELRELRQALAQR